MSSGKIYTFEYQMLYLYMVVLIQLIMFLIFMLHIYEVVNSMKYLIDYTYKNGVGPIGQPHLTISITSYVYIYAVIDNFTIIFGGSIGELDQVSMEK